MARRILLRLGGPLMVLAGVTLAQTARVGSAQQPFMPPAPSVPIPAGAAERLAGSLRIQTISTEDLPRSRRTLSGRCTRIVRRRSPGCIRISGERA